MKNKFLEDGLVKYDGLIGLLICGAKTKSTGRPCRIKDVYSNGRCRYHGGLSTGPKTEEGKRRSAINGFKKGWRQRVKL